MGFIIVEEGRYLGGELICGDGIGKRDRSYIWKDFTAGPDFELASKSFACNISNTSDSVSSGYPNTEKRVENTTRSGVFLTQFEVFG